MGTLTQIRDQELVSRAEAAIAAQDVAVAAFTENLTYRIAGEENRLCGFLAATMVVVTNLIILSTTLI